MLGDCFLTVTPTALTMSGNIGKAWETRFWTNTWAVSRLTPSLKVTVREYEPSLLHCDDMYIMFSTPLICCSMGAATVSETTWAFAPGYWQVTWIVGGVISGYWEIGRLIKDISPISTMMIEITQANTGRSMKKRANTRSLRR